MLTTPLSPFILPFAVDTPLLQVDALLKQYDTGGDEPLTVLRDLDLAVQEGEILAIVGESGTGKSTLLHLLGALDRPTDGTVRFAGTDLFAKSDEELAAFRNRSIGFVFQFHHLLPEFTALENVAMPALIQHRSLADVTPRAHELLALLGLDDRADHRPRTLSGGEKQRVAIARALMNEPALVLMDEPTGNLDARTAEPLHREIERLSREMDHTFVLASHDPSLAEVAGRVLRLEHGTLHPLAAADEMAPEAGPSDDGHAGG
ncbi:lipoprotein-releasing system ATP-binding protein [Salinibacter ruber]|uniref:ABC transporter ATP-binding protein n=1 Tax=Salinibacter ruber TaxID=146919 RepID=UPI0021670F87|nr:lipoprotein-releasing system ATP-binding protein [Salinibacter ruber]